MLLALLLCGALAAAGVEAPLGPYARPGVPVLVRTDAPVRLDVEGWAYRIEGEGVIHPARVPCTVRDADGNTVLRLEPVPDDALVVGAVGPVPAAIAPEDARVVPITLPPASHWRALELFDVVVVSDPRDWTPALTTWVRGGGTVLLLRSPDPLGGDAGLGAVVGPPFEFARRRVPRAGNTRPEIYELVPAPGSAAPAWRSMRWVVWGACLAFAVQVGLAALGLLPRRLLWGGLVLVALAGLAVGLARTRADYTPVARGDLVVSWFRDGWERRRTYRAYLRVGPGASAPEAGPDTPILYGSNTTAWWGEPGTGAPLGEGIVRIYLSEEVRPGRPTLPLAEPRGPGRQPPLAAALAGRPAGPWRIGATKEIAPPAADPARIPVLGTVEVALQD